MNYDNSIKNTLTEDFWLQKLKGVNSNGFFNRPMVGEPSATGERESIFISLSAQQMDSLKKVSKGKPANEYIILNAALYLLCKIYQGTDDLLIGTSKFVQSGNTDDALLYFRPKIEAGTTGRELLKAILTELNGMAHQDQFEFENFYQRFGHSATGEPAALFQVALQHEGVNQSSSLLDRFKLLFQFENSDGGLVLSLKYAADQFSKEESAQLARHYLQLVETMIKGINQPVSSYSVLDKEETEKLTLGLNKTLVDEPATTIVESFAKVVNTFPGNTAFCFENTAFDYTELDNLAIRLGNYLRRTCSIGREDVVAILLEPSSWVIPSMLAVLKSGGSYLPIPANLPKEQIAFILKDAGAKAIITDSMKMFDVIEYFTGGIVAIDVQIEGMQDHTALELVNEPADTAYVIYTSGTTGRPKGVKVSHRSLDNYCNHICRSYSLNENDRSVLVSSHAFDLGYTSLWCTLLSGGTLHQVAENLVKETSRLIDYMLEAKISFIKLTPSLFYMIRHSSNFASLSSSDLRLMLCGGEEIRPDDLKALKTLLPEITLVNHYGPTEATIGCLTHTIHDLDQFAKRPVIGVPISNMQAYVLDEKLNPLPLGIVGDLYVSGLGLSSGYLNRDELTKERFTEHPFLEGQKIYKTGDRACRWHDGQIEYLGREDRQVKIRGYRIELQEIEEKLRAFEGVERTAVLVGKDGENLKYLSAFIQGISEESLKTLKAEMRQALPEYKIPRDFILVEKFPVNANGKVNFKELSKLKEVKSMDNYEAPRNALEEKIVAIWEEVLCKEGIGISDNYFEIGGDSLKGIRVVNKIQDYLGEIVHVGILFDAPTIAELSQRLTRNNEAGGLDEAKIAEMRRIIMPLKPYTSQGKKNPRAVFILAPPRSGSTLLRIMLDGHPGLFAPPELQLLLFNTLKEREEVFQGRLGGYKEGSLRAMMELDGISAEEAQAQMDARIEAGMDVKTFYGEIIAKLNGRILVDKSPSYGRDLEILKRGEAYFEDAIYIHLQRNPYGLIHSYEDTRMDQIFRYKNEFAVRELGELEWLVSHQNITKFLEGIPASRKHQVKFEDLVKKPNQTMSRLCQSLGLNDEGNAMTAIYSDAENRMTDGLHKESKMIGDIKFFQHKKIDPKVADKWRTAYTSNFLHPKTEELAAQFGYETNLQATYSDLTKVEAAADYAVSHAQKRLWLIDQLSEDQFAYNQPRSYELKGKLDQNALVQAFEALVQRHESMRTVFQTVEGTLRQRVLDFSETAFHVAITDLSKEQNAAAKALEIGKEDSTTPFDLSKGPLIRVQLVKIAEERNILFMNSHHIICDGWSIRVMMEELSALYQAFCNGQENPLTPLAIQYKDFTHWQNGQLEGDNLAEHENYWMEQFKEEVPELALQSSYTRPTVQTFNGNQHSVKLTQTASERLKEMGKKHGTSLFMTLTASLKALLYRYTGQEDLVLGTPIAGRNHEQLDRQVGFYINALALRTRFSGEDNFIDLLQKVRTTSLNAYQHQVYPFDLLVEKLGLDRDMSRAPLFDIFVTMENIEIGNEAAIGLAGLEIQPTEQDFSVSKFDLAFSFKEETDGIELDIEYNTDLFSEAYVQQLEKHYLCLVESILSNQASSLKELAYLSQSEQADLVTNFNATSVDYPADKTVQACFEEIAKAYSTKTAINFKGKNLTYRELNEQANRIAHYLRTEFEVQADDLVGLMVKRSEIWPALLLGILKSGAAFLPLDPSYPSNRLQEMAEDAEVKVLLFDDEMEGTFQLENTLSLGKLLAAAATASKENPKRVNTSSDLAYVMYTSGSTGKPKGVMIEHKSILRLVRNNNYVPLNEETRILQTGSLSFDASTFEVWGSLLNGGSLFLLPQEELMDPSILGKAIRSNEINTFWITSGWFNQLVDIDTSIFDEMKYILTGGEKISEAHVKQLLAANQSVQLINFYGPTENTTFSTFHLVESVGKASIPIGKPISNCETYVLDNDGELCGIGVLGELHVGGDGLARGYLGREDLTKEKFIQSKYGKGGRLYKTGDLVHWRTDGTLAFVGRKDNQVKLRGFRIELSEVEKNLLKHEAVIQAAVLMQKDESGSNYLSAYLVTKEGKAENFELFLSDKLPGHMVPKFFTCLEEFPLTVNGKLDRKALAASAKHSKKIDLSLPRTSDEKKMLEIWKEVLGLEEISTDANFFSLGGHSLKAMQLITRILSEFNVRIELKSVFMNATIESLALKVSKITTSDHQKIEAVEKQPDYLLSHAQKRLWILEQVEATNGAYNMNWSYVIDNLDEEALKMAFRSLVERHEILRTNIISVSGQPRQVVREGASNKFKVNTHDLSKESRPLATAKKMVGQLANKTFDLANDALIRVDLLKIAENKVVLSLVLHHIICDGWSMQVLMKELIEYYECYKDGKELYLSPLGIQYKDYAAWQHKELQGPRLKTHQNYWKSRFSGEVEVLSLPLDYHRPQQQSFRGKHLNFTLDKEATAGLKKIGQQEGSTLFMTMLSVVNILLYRYTGQSDVIVGTSVTGRENKDLEGQIGFYINMLALRNQVEEGQNFSSFLQGVKQSTLEAFEHQMYPFDKLVSDLKLSRELGRNPLFDVVVASLGVPGNSQEEQLSKEFSSSSLQVSQLEDNAENEDHSKQDLRIGFMDLGEEILINLRYNPDLFKDSTMKVVQEWLTNLVKHIVFDPAESIEKLKFSIAYDEAVQETVDENFAF